MEVKEDTIEINGDGEIINRGGKIKAKISSARNSVIKLLFHIFPSSLLFP